MTIEMVTVGGVGFSLRRKLLGTVRCAQKTEGTRFDPNANRSEKRYRHNSF
jgi:hypothetical protein